MELNEIEYAISQGTMTAAKVFTQMKQHIPSSRSPTCSTARDDIELADVIAWADGVVGALGTEHAGKVTDDEARIAWAIKNAPK